MRFLCFVSACLISLGTLSSANAGVLLSPTSAGSLAGTGVTDVGGIVLDLVGSNGTRVVSQLSASSLFEGNLNISPGEIGTQTGFDNSVTGQLGGGITEAAVRITHLMVIPRPVTLMTVTTNCWLTASILAISQMLLRPRLTQPEQPLLTRPLGSATTFSIPGFSFQTMLQT